MSERTITKEQYWQASGLLALAHKYVEKLDEIEMSLCETLDVDREIGGHCGDAIFNKFPVETLLERLHLAADKDVR